jgi:Domain of unknown function (DUF1844)
MAEKKREEFTVTDRRLFTPEGERRDDARDDVKTEEPPAPQASSPQPAPPQPSAAPESATPESQIPQAPTAAEQQAQHDAYHTSTKGLDEQLHKELGGRARDLEMTFERFVASLYMTALLQLGLVHEQGAQPQVDLLSARQTIDTLGILQDKTKGNLTMSEQNLLQNSLYELRMAYVEVTNALAHPPQPTGSEAGPRSR